MVDTTTPNVDATTSALLAAVGISDKDYQQAKLAASAIVGQQADATPGMVQTAKDASAPPIVSLAQGLADLKTQQTTQDLATRMGTNPYDASNILGQLADQWNQSALTAVKAHQELNDKLNTSFFDNPASYIVNQFTMGDSINRANAADAAKSSIEDSLAHAQSQTQGIAAISAGLATTKTAATVVATVQQVAAQAQKSADETSTKLAGFNISGINALQSMSSEQIRNLSTANQSQIAEMQLNMAQERFQLETKTAEVSLAKLKLDMDNDQLNSEAQSAMVSTVQKGFKMLFPGSNVPVIPPKQVLALMKMKDPVFDEYYKLGSVQGAMGSPVISDNAGLAARLVSITGATLTPAQGSIKDLLKEGWSVASTPALSQQNGLGNYDNKNPAAVADAANKFLLANATKMAQNIKPQDNSNIYSAPPLNTLMQITGVADDPAIAKILGPQIATGVVQQFNPSLVADQFASAVKKGTITLAQAEEGLHTLAAASVVNNNATRMYAATGLPMQRSFNINAENSLGFNSQYNIYSRADIDKLMVNKMYFSGNNILDATGVPSANRPVGLTTATGGPNPVPKDDAYMPGLGEDGKYH